MASLYGKWIYGKGFYSADLTGALAVTQSANALAGTIGVIVGGALIQTQANQTLAAGTSIPVTGGLSVNQASQAFVGHGTVLSGSVGNLNLVQASQTLSAAGTASGLAIVQASQTLSATGTVKTASLYGVGPYGKGLYSRFAMTGSLVVTQAPNTLVASGKPTGLHIRQADQTLIATAKILGTSIRQDDQTLVATARHGFSGWTEASCPPSMWTPTDPCHFLPPSSASPYGKGDYSVGNYGLSGTGWQSSKPPAVIWQPSEPCNG